MKTTRVRINRQAVAKRLIELVIPYVEQYGTPMICGGNLQVAQPVRAELGDVEIHYLPKAARLTQAPPPHLLDIYLKGGGKVFSAWFDPVELVSIKPGQWLFDLLEYLEPERAAA